MNSVFCPRETLHVLLNVLARKGIKQVAKNIPALVPALSQQQPLALTELLTALRQAQTLCGCPTLMLEFGQTLALALPAHSDIINERITLGKMTGGSLKQLFHLHTHDVQQRRHYSLQWLGDGQQAPQELLEIVLAFLSTRSRLGLSPYYDHIDVYLPYPAPDYYAQYAAFVPLRLHFASPWFAVYLPPAALLNPEPTDALFGQGIQTSRLVLEQARNCLRRHLHNPPSQLELAQQLNLSERTFKRRLHDCNSHYQSLLADLRLSQAQHWLALRQHRVTDIAERLGYSNVANFSKAFKKWCGLAPTQVPHQPIKLPISMRTVTPPGWPAVSAHQAEQRILDHLQQLEQRIAVGQ